MLLIPGEQNSVMEKTGEEVVVDGDVIRFATLSTRATPPFRDNEKSVCFALFSAYNYTIPSHGKIVCLTDIQVTSMILV